MAWTPGSKLRNANGSCRSRNVVPLVQSVILVQFSQTKWRNDNPSTSGCKRPLGDGLIVLFFEADVLRWSNAQTYSSDTNSPFEHDEPCIVNINSIETPCEAEWLNHYYYYYYYIIIIISCVGWLVSWSRQMLSATMKNDISAIEHVHAIDHDTEYWHNNIGRRVDESLLALIELDGCLRCEADALFKKVTWYTSDYLFFWLAEPRPPGPTKENSTVPAPCTNGQR